MLDTEFLQWQVKKTFFRQPSLWVADGRYEDSVPILTALKDTSLLPDHEDAQEQQGYTRERV